MDYIMVMNEKRKWCLESGIIVFLRSKKVYVFSVSFDKKNLCIIRLCHVGTVTPKLKF